MDLDARQTLQRAADDLNRVVNKEGARTREGLKRLPPLLPALDVTASPELTELLEALNVNQDNLEHRLRKIESWIRARVDEVDSRQTLREAADALVRVGNAEVAANRRGLERVPALLKEVNVATSPKLEELLKDLTVNQDNLEFCLREIERRLRARLHEVEVDPLLPGSEAVCLRVGSQNSN
jgi:hypothetical protein